MTPKFAESTDEGVSKNMKNWKFTASSPVPTVEEKKELNLTDTVTLEAWIKPQKQNGGGGRIIDKSEAGTSIGYLLDTHPGNSLRMITQHGTLTFDAKLPVGEWVHVAGVFSVSGKIFKLYVNGKEVADASKEGMIPLTKSPVTLRFGADSNNANRFLGEMARATVYSRALSGEELKKLAENKEDKLKIDTSGCVGSWVFETPGTPKLFTNMVPGGAAITMETPEGFDGKANAPENPGMRLWYRVPAYSWNEAMPLGNGRLGAMVFGGVKQDLLQLNEDTLWSGMPHDYNKKGAYKYLPEIRKLLFEGNIAEATKVANREFMSDPLYQQSYQPLGDLVMDFPGHSEIKNYRRELDIENGVMKVTYEINGVRYLREYFISAADQVLVVRVSANKKSALNMVASLRCPHHHEFSFDGNNRLIMKGYWEGDGKVRGVQTDFKGIGLKFEGCLDAFVKEGNLEKSDDKLVVKNADSVLLIFAAATSYVNYKDISADPAGRWKPVITKSETKGYDGLLAAHIAEHSALMNRVTLTLENGTAAKDADIESFITPQKAMKIPTNERLEAIKNSQGSYSDPDLVKLYAQFGRYLLISSSRPGSQPANLQGIWNKDVVPAWGSKYTININIEMNYWPAEVGNLGECQEPLFGMLNDLRVTGRETAKEYYNARGFVAHHNTDLWRGAAAVDGIWGVWPMSAAWMARHPYEHYLYSQDKKFLRETAWPIMKDAALFILDFLIPAPAGSPVEGKLVTNPSHSPENSFRRADGSTAQFTYAASMDLEIIRDLFENCINAAKDLSVEEPGFEDDFIAEVKKSLAGLAPLQISKKDGRLQEWVEDYDDAEPGHRHMSHFYALHPGAQISKQKTPELFAALRKSLDKRLSNGGGGTGWSRAWVVNFAARFEDPDLAWKNCQLLLARSTLPNLFDNHPPFQIDGNFGGSAGIMEMLLQSHTGELNLLPALPSEWGSGSVGGLRARGAFEVNMNWCDGNLMEVSILSLAGKPCQIRYKDKVVRFETEAGKLYVLNNQLTVK